MVNRLHAVAVKCCLVLWLAAAALGQDAASQERRLQELERKMRQLDPAFATDAGTSAGTSMEERLRRLEQTLDELLAARQAAVSAPLSAQVVAPPSRQAAPPISAVVASPQAMSTGPANASAAPTMADVGPLQPLSIRGDYQSTGEGETRLPIAGYMEAHFNKDRGEPGRGDFHRFVLLFGHSFSERIKFWSEFELEHALVEGREEKGEIALEQAYLDFLIKPWLNVRGGMLLSPMGIVNERHEPPSFNGVERPFVETLIIPSTWREIGFGLTGDLGRGFRYRTYLMSALDAAGLSAEFGLADAKTGGFEAPFRNPAYVGRLEYAGVRRLTVGVSGYTGVASGTLQSVTPRVSIASADGRFSVGRLDLRGVFAQTWIGKAAELNDALERQVGFGANIGSQMRGYYVEPGVHLFPRRQRHDLIAFTRYEKYNTQHRMPAGFVPLDEFNRSSWVTGVTYKPNADVAVKFDYIVNRNASSFIRARDSLNLGLGWWF